MYTTYAIQNEKDEIYIGHTDDLKTRIKRHNGELPSKNTSYTSKRRKGKWKIINTESFQTRAEAVKREKQLKSYRGRQFVRDSAEKKDSE